MIPPQPTKLSLPILAVAALSAGMSVGGHRLATAEPEPGRQEIGRVIVLIETELGDIEVELDGARAPITVANFLRYVDVGRYDGGRFHRSVRLDNQAREDVLIEVVQAGTNRERGQRFDAIALERTRDTGLKHLDGALSMARSGPDTARSDFFICIGDQPALDYGGARNADGQGFAVFGRVVRGMEVVRRIHQSPTADRERLAPPIGIVKMTRITRPRARFPPGVPRRAHGAQRRETRTVPR